MAETTLQQYGMVNAGQRTRADQFHTVSLRRQKRQKHKHEILTHRARYAF